VAGRVDLTSYVPEGIGSLVRLALVGTNDLNLLARIATTNGVGGVLSVPDRFLDDVLGAPQGCVVACNMLDCLDLGLVDESFVADLWLKWYQAFIDRVRAFRRGVPRSRLQQELMFALDAVLQGPSDPGSDDCTGANDLRLRCVVRGGPAPTAGFTHATRADLFVDHVMHRDDRRRLVAGAVLLPSAGSAAPGFKWRGHGPWRVALKDGATLGRPGGVVWLTLSHTLVADIASVDAADRVRNRLGLVHHASGVALLAIRIESGVMAGKKVGRPTFADAGSHRRFRSMADKSVNRRRKTWGCSVDLSLLAGGEKWVDGVPERVACPLSRREAVSVEIRYLGETRTDLGSDPADDVAFAERLSSRHGLCDDVRGRMKRVLA